MDEVNLKLRMPHAPTVPPANGNSPSQIRDAHTDTTPHTSAAGLIANLLQVLNEEQILYCHWKSNWKLNDWLAGDGDLDLLVRRCDVSRFVSALGRLGFKRALLPQRKEVPGIMNYYGYDESSQRFVHVHAHYQLALGHDATKNYRIPVERQLLESANHDGVIPVTAPEIELALLVIRMTLKHSIAESAARGLMRKSRSHSAVVRDEIECLKRRIDLSKFTDDFRRVFPMIDRNLFDECLDAFVRGAAGSRHAILKHRLQKCLKAHARRSLLGAELQTIREYLMAGLSKFASRATARKRFDTGGCLIAVVGGDGSGKSTCISDLKKWLGNSFDITAAHLGRPPGSAATLAVIAATRLRRWISALLPNSGKHRERPEFDCYKPQADLLLRLRWICRARDRYRLYKKIRRIASNGGIVICDRFPTERLRRMDGPRIRQSLNGSSGTPINRVLINREEWYYRHIMPPDLLVVLRADPIIAAARKLTEPRDYVIPRATELWEIDWSGTGAQIVNADRSLDEVLADVRAIVWAEL